MNPIDGQFAILSPSLKATPLLPWSIVGRLLWDIAPEILEELNILADEYTWYTNYFFDNLSHDRDTTVMVTDKNMRICCVSENVKQLSGYENYELIYSTPKVLQGKDTSPEIRKIIAQAVARNIPFEARLINYTKDKKPYGCELKVFPIFNEKDFCTHFIAFENEYELV